jgi:hypothetical protein
MLAENATLTFWFRKTPVAAAGGDVVETSPVPAEPGMDWPAWLCAAVVTVTVTRVLAGRAPAGWKVAMLLAQVTAPLIGPPGDEALNELELSVPGDIVVLKFADIWARVEMPV